MSAAAPLVLRLLLAIAGGYALTAAVVALATALLAGTMPRAEAFALSAMLGFLVYLGLLLWAFAERRLLRVALAVIAGAPGCFALARAVGG